MTTKDRDSLKGILKEIKKERNAETAVAIKLKSDNRVRLKELDDKGWNRAVISPNKTEPKLDIKPIIPKKKAIKKTPKIDPEKVKLAKELQEAKDKLAAIEAAKELEKEEEAEIIEEVIKDTE